MYTHNLISVDRYENQCGNQAGSKFTVHLWPSVLLNNCRAIGKCIRDRREDVLESKLIEGLHCVRVHHAELDLHRSSHHLLWQWSSKILKRGGSRLIIIREINNEGIQANSIAALQWVHNAC